MDGIERQLAYLASRRSSADGVSERETTLRMLQSHLLRSLERVRASLASVQEDVERIQEYCAAHQAMPPLVDVKEERPAPPRKRLGASASSPVIPKLPLDRLGPDPDL